MTASNSNPVTQLLEAAGNGDDSAMNRLWTAVYEELRQIARHQLVHESPGRTLDTTSLVHEAFLRLIGDEPINWQNRRHFFGAAARAMRRIRVDDARRRGRLKRGGEHRPLPLDNEPAVLDADPAQVLALDEALQGLEAAAPRQAEVVMLRFFAGLSVDETAAALSLSARTVDAQWRYAKAWLHRALSRDGRGWRAGADTDDL